MGILAMIVVLAAILSGSGQAKSHAPPSLSGRTAAGSEYRLRWVRERRIGSNRPVLELDVARVPGEGLRQLGRISGKPVAGGKLLIAADVLCDRPTETLFWGRLPAGAVHLVVRTWKGKQVTAAVTPPDAKGARLFLAAVRGAVSRATAVIANGQGDMVGRRSLDLGDPCEGQPPGASSDATALLQ